MLKTHAAFLVIFHSGSLLCIDLQSPVLLNDVFILVIALYLNNLYMVPELSLPIKISPAMLLGDVTRCINMSFSILPSQRLLTAVQHRSGFVVFRPLQRNLIDQDRLTHVGPVRRGSHPHFQWDCLHHKIVARAFKISGDF